MSFVGPLIVGAVICVVNTFMWKYARGLLFIARTSRNYRENNRFYLLLCSLIESYNKSQLGIRSSEGG